MPARRTFSFSAGSMSRTPTSATRVASSSGAAPIRRARASGPKPRQAASGMPWTLPLGLVSGVLQSACASNQIRPSDSFCAAEVAHGSRDGSHRDGMVAAENQRDAAVFQEFADVLGGPAADRGDFLHVARAAVGERLRLGNDHRQVAGIFDFEPHFAQARLQAGGADRRGTHVYAAAALAEVERDAEDFDLRGWHGVGFGGDFGGWGTVTRSSVGGGQSPDHPFLEFSPPRSVSGDCPHAAPMRPILRSLAGGLLGGFRNRRGTRKRLDNRREAWL